MKKIYKILILTAVLSLAFALLLLTASAAEGGETAYAVYRDEEHYKTDPEHPTVVSSLDSINADHINRGGYLVAYKDLKLEVNVLIMNGASVTIDLNGHKMTSTGSLTAGANGEFAPTYLTVKNGHLVHSYAQFFKPQPSSTTLLENLVIDINMSWGNFIYGDSFKSFIIKDSVLNVNPSRTSGLKICDITPPNQFKYNGLLGQYDDDERTYVMNFIFDNSKLINNQADNTFIYFRDATGVVSYLDIAFINGSTFTNIADGFISTDEDPSPRSGITIGIAKGTKFSEKKVPISINHPQVTVAYYNSIELRERYLAMEGLTELAPAGYTPDGDERKLIWGFSADPEYPNMLCHELYTVNFYNTDGVLIDVDMMGYDGYADGLVLERKLPATGYFFVGEGKDLSLYENIHAGWTSNPSSSESSDRITVSGDSDYYPVFRDVGPARAAIFTSPDMSVDSIYRVFMDPVIDEDAFKDIESYAYLRLFADAELSFDETVHMLSDLVIDLGGSTLSAKKSGGAFSSFFSTNGYNLNVKNGELRLPAVTLADVKGGEVRLDSADVSFSVYPVITLSDSSLSINKCTVTQLTGDTLVPAILVTGGAVDMDISETDVSVSGPLMSTRADADMNAVLNSCDIKRADSVFGITSSVAQLLGKDGSLNIEMTDCNAVCTRLFDIPRVGGKNVIKAEYRLFGGKYSTDPSDVYSGSVYIPDGYRIVAVKDGQYAFAIIPSALTAKFNMRIEYDFVASFSLPVSDSIISVSTYLDTYSAEDLKTVNIDGDDYYVVSISGISPADSLGDYSVTVKYTDFDGRVVSSVLTQSPTEYFSSLLRSDDPLLARLCAAVMRYIGAAYEYTDNVLTDAFVELTKSDLYLGLLREVDKVPLLTGDGSENMSYAFRSASLYLSSEVYLVLNIKEGFNGNITVGGSEYAIIDGRFLGNTYIKYEISPNEMYESEIRITCISSLGETVHSVYSLFDYMSAMPDNTEAERLIEALYLYCYEASVFMNGGVIPPFIDTMPSVGVVIK